MSAGGDKAAGSQAEEGSRGAWVRENVEAIVIAIVLALLIKQFAMEAFVIPTGSMAPTLLGAHVDVECPSCGFEQSVSEGVLKRAPDAVGVCPECGRQTRGYLPEDARRSTLPLRPQPCRECGTLVPLTRTRASHDHTGDQAVPCQNCRFAFKPDVEDGGWPFGSVSRGDRILVNKWIYRFQDPKRFEVAVFKFPDDPNENYIKRIAGLPGEDLDIQGGDLYIDGHIARKPREVQAGVWMLVNDSAYPETKQVKRAWQGRTGSWARSKDLLSYKGKAEGDDVAWLAFPEPITDWHGYNTDPVTRSGDNAVADVRLGFTAQLGGASGEVVAALRFGEQSIEARIGGERAHLTAPGLDKSFRLATDQVGDIRKDPVDIVLWRADQQVYLEVGGEVVAHHYLPVSAPPEGETEDAAARRAEAASRVEVGVAGGEVRVKDLTIHRDIYYLRELSSRDTVTLPYHLGEGEFFALGDNSSNSTDSRGWGVVPRGHLVGRAFMVFWPALPGDFAVRRIR